MKMRMIFLLITILCFSCKTNSDSSEQTAYMIKFNSMTIEQKVTYINNLKGDQVGEFFKEFLPEAVFSYPPNVTIKFYKDGSILVDSIDYSERDFKIAYWKIENNTIHIWKKNDNIPYPPTRDEILSFEYVERGGGDLQNRLNFTFNESTRGMTNINYIKHGEYVGGIDYYERHSKKK